MHLESIEHLRIHFPCYNTPLLEELRPGDFQGLTTAQIRTLHPEEFEKRKQNKLTYRFAISRYMVRECVIGCVVGIREWVGSRIWT